MPNAVLKYRVAAITMSRCSPPTARAQRDSLGLDLDSLERISSIFLAALSWRTFLYMSAYEVRNDWPLHVMMPTPDYHSAIFNPISFIAMSASAFPRASSIGSCVCVVFRRCLKFWKVSLTIPLYSEPRFVLEWPNGFPPVKCQKYQLMNCQSKPLLSLTNITRPFVFPFIQPAKFSITVFGSSKPRVSSRVNPVIARASERQLSEIGFSLP